MQIGDSKPPELLLLTGIRSIACIIVIGFHYGRSSVAENTFLANLFGNGYDFVGFFIVLSGFVMFYTYARDYKSKDSFQMYPYAIGRFARIYPMYILVIGLSLLLHPSQNFEAIFLYATLLHSWSSTYVFSFVGNVWTVSCEIFFYVCFPVIREILYFTFGCHTRAGLAPTKKSFNTVLIEHLFGATLMWLLNVLLGYYFYSTDPNSSQKFLPVLRLPQFILGAIIGHLFLIHINESSPTERTIYWPLMAVSAITGLLLLLGHLSPPGVLNGAYPYICLGLFNPLHLLVIYSLSITSLLTVQEARKSLPLVDKACCFMLTGLVSKPILSVGKASYCIYLLQQPIHTMFRDKPFLWYLLIEITTSVVCYYCIEEPVRADISFKLLKNRCTIPQSNSNIKSGSKMDV